MDEAGEKRLAITRFRSGVGSSLPHTEDGFTGTRKKCSGNVLPSHCGRNAKVSLCRRIVVVVVVTVTSPGVVSDSRRWRKGVIVIFIHDLAGLSFFFILKYNFIGAILHAALWRGEWLAVGSACESLSPALLRCAADSVPARCVPRRRSCHRLAACRSEVQDAPARSLIGRLKEDGRVPLARSLDVAGRGLVFGSCRDHMC